MSRNQLRKGFSTGTAAAAAARAALECLLTDRAPESVPVRLPQGGDMTIPIVEACRRSAEAAEAAVIKDAGDDPDVTHRAEIRVSVQLAANGGPGGVTLRGGTGVGTVTRPGLDVPVGQPAINPVPRKMIEENLALAWKEAGRTDPLAVEVEIAVPQGERLAVHTLNPRLGIVGGISILGTTGLVTPFSHEAYTATIESGLNVARAAGLAEVVLTTGGRSEKWAMRQRPDLPEPAFIQIADFFGFALREAGSRGFTAIGLVSFFGKAVKQAQGLVYTHAHRAPMDLSRLADWLTEDDAAELAGEIRGANTARHALEILKAADALSRVPLVGERMLDAARRFAGPDPALWGRIVDLDGAELFAGSRESRA